MRVLLLIRSLDRGGAERQVIALARGLAVTAEVLVTTFYDNGSLRPELDAAGVRTASLRKRGRWDLWRPLWRLYRLLRRWRPDVVQGYLPEANILALVAGRAAGVPAIVWGVRSSNMDYSRYDWFSGWCSRLAARMSRWPDLIIANSHGGRRHHISRGYPPAKVEVVPNGIDTVRFRPDPGLRAATRQAWGVGPGEPLVGVVGRLDPMKGHELFLTTAAKVRRACPDVRFACIGDGPRTFRERLETLASTLGLSGSVLWTGELEALNPAYNALDVFCLPSLFGEGFSNALGEAMACGLPCVATDVGDAATILGADGIVVLPNDPEALAAALLGLINCGAERRRALGMRARGRIEAYFSTERMVDATRAAYERLLGVATA